MDGGEVAGGAIGNGDVGLYFDCISDSCGNGFTNATYFVYDPTKTTPNPACADCDLTPLRMPMVAVALDAKTGKPLSFIVEESSSE